MSIATTQLGPKQAADIEAPPVLSIIITSYAADRLNDIIELLNSITLQTYKRFEVVVVVERSKVLERELHIYWEKNCCLNMRIIFTNEKLGLSGSRNLAAKEAIGDIFAFIDDDVILFPKWAEEVVNTFKDDSVVGVTGPAFLLSNIQSLEWFPAEFQWLIGGTGWFDQKSVSTIRNAWGMNMSFRGEAFISCSGFNNDFGLRNSSRKTWADPPSEDVDFSFRVKKKTGKRIVFNPKVSVFHKVNNKKLSFLFIMQRAFSVGYQRHMIKKIYRFNDSTMFESENKLINRIVVKLIPSIFSDSIKSPSMALHKFLVTSLILVFVAFGYTSVV